MVLMIQSKKIKILTLFIYQSAQEFDLPLIMLQVCSSFLAKFLHNIVHIYFH